MLLKEERFELMGSFVRLDMKSFMPCRESSREKSRLSNAKVDRLKLARSGMESILMFED